MKDDDAIMALAHIVIALRDAASDAVSKPHDPLAQLRFQEEAERSMRVVPPNQPALTAEEIRLNLTEGQMTFTPGDPIEMVYFPGVFGKVDRIEDGLPWVTLERPVLDCEAGVSIPFHPHEIKLRVQRVVLPGSLTEQPTKSELRLRWEELKKQRPGMVLFFRHETETRLYGEDAEEAATILTLPITLTDDGGEWVTVSFPHTEAATNIRKLLLQGKRIAIVEKVK